MIPPWTAFEMRLCSTKVSLGNAGNGRPPLNRHSQLCNCSLSPAPLDVCFYISPPLPINVQPPFRTCETTCQRTFLPYLPHDSLCASHLSLSILHSVFVSPAFLRFTPHAQYLARFIFIYKT